MSATHVCAWWCGAPLVFDAIIPSGAKLIRITASCASISPPRRAPSSVPPAPTTAQLLYEQRAGSRRRRSMPSAPPAPAPRHSGL
eukprot:4555276-Prymnesium_polylepis.1